MLIEVHNVLSLVKHGNLPTHLFGIFNFMLKKDSYVISRIPNMPIKKKSIFFPRYNAFLTGALPLLLQKYPCEIVDCRLKPQFDASKIKSPEWLFPHQTSAFSAMLSFERGIIHHTTSAGKTYLCSGWVSTVPCKHLVLVRSKEILDQFVARFDSVLGPKNYDLIWGKATRINNKSVTLAMIQSLAPRVLRHELSVADYDSIIADEGHHIGWATQYTTIFISAERAFYRFSLTGTPVREGGDQIAHIGMVGPVFHKYTYEDAVKDGFVTPVHIFQIKLPWCPIKTVPVEPYHDFYIESIINNGVRNNLIADIAVLNIISKTSTLIICNEIVHEEILLDLIVTKLKEKNVPNAMISRSVTFVHGKDKERDQKRKDFEDGIIVCLIGSTLYDEGIDIHRIQSVILAAGGKSGRALKQRIGRGQRLGDNKKVVTVFDFDDSFTKKTAQHARMRLKLYLSENYTVEGIVCKL